MTELLIKKEGAESPEFENVGQATMANYLKEHFGCEVDETTSWNRLLSFYAEQMWIVGRAEVENAPWVEPTIAAMEEGHVTEAFWRQAGVQDFLAASPYRIRRRTLGYRTGSFYEVEQPGTFDRHRTTEEDPYLVVRAGYQIPTPTKDRDIRSLFVDNNGDDFSLEAGRALEPEDHRWLIDVLDAFRVPKDALSDRSTRVRLEASSRSIDAREYPLVHELNGRLQDLLEAPGSEAWRIVRGDITCLAGFFIDRYDRRLEVVGVVDDSGVTEIEKFSIDQKYGERREILRWGDEDAPVAHIVNGKEREVSRETVLELAVRELTNFKLGILARQEESDSRLRLKYPPFSTLDTVRPGDVEFLNNPVIREFWGLTDN